MFSVLRKKNFLFLLKIPISKAALSFGLFSGSSTFLFKFLLWFLRRVRNCEDKYNAIMAGFLSSLTLILEPNHSIRKMLWLHMLANSFYSGLSTLDSNKVVKKPKNWAFFWIWLILWWLVVQFVINPDILGPKTVEFFRDIWLMTKNDFFILGELLNRRDTELNGNKFTILGRV